MPQTTIKTYYSYYSLPHMAQVATLPLMRFESELIRSCRVRLGRRILVVGCGPGREARALAELGYQVTGVDCSPDMILTAVGMSRQPENISFCVADGQALPFPADSFDAVVLFNILSNYPDDPVGRKIKGNMLSECRRVVKKGGMLLFWVWGRFSRVVLVFYKLMAFPLAAVFQERYLCLLLGYPFAKMALKQRLRIQRQELRYLWKINDGRRSVENVRGGHDESWNGEFMAHRYSRKDLAHEITSRGWSDFWCVSSLDLSSSPRWPSAWTSFFLCGRAFKSAV